MGIADSHGRKNLISALNEIQSPSTKEAWLEGDNKVEWRFDLVVHTLLDDIDIFDDPYERVGETSLDIFKDDQELNLVRKLCIELNALVAKLGDVKASEYVKSREWSVIIEMADQALKHIF